MSDDLYRLLRRERARQAERRLALGDAWPDTGMVAVDAKGNPYSPNAVSLAFTRFIQAHHLPKITLHGLRHTFATVASAQGAPCSTSARPWATPPPPPRSRSTPTCWIRTTPPPWTGWQMR